MIPRVLSIAGTDPTGGAGIQADLKSISANGGYGMAVVTSLVAQNTQGVRSIHVPPVSFLREQLDSVSDDVHIDAVKIGMLFTREVISEVHDWLQRNRPPIIVLDPVMVATSGDRLLDSSAEDALRKLLPIVDLITPNLPELAVLARKSVALTWEDALTQARSVSEEGAVTVLVKGGHFSGEQSPDALVDVRGTLPGEREVIEFLGERIHTRNTHGTGCSLSSAIATLLAQNQDLEEALINAKAWLTESLRHADELGVGHGRGPLNHFATLWKSADRGSVSQPITQEWWDQIADIRLAIHELEFVRALGDGTLEDSAFSEYILQDLLYLKEFSRLLGKTSELAPTETEKLFWASCEEVCVREEMAMHREVLNGQPEPKPTPVTAAYLQHLSAIELTKNYATLVAALLPCLWLYQHVGESFQHKNHPEHPYSTWLATYSDPEFAESTRRAIEIVDNIGSHASEVERRAMWDAFWVSSQHELAFFDIPHR